MFPDNTEPIEILQYAYLNAKMFPIDFPTEIAVLCNYRKLNHYTSLDDYFHQNVDLNFFTLKPLFYIDNVVVLFISGFSITSNELHQKLSIMALVIR